MDIHSGQLNRLVSASEELPAVIVKGIHHSLELILGGRSLLPMDRPQSRRGPRPPVVVHPHTLKALQEVTGRGSTPHFRTPEQGEVLQLLLGTHREHILYIAPTASGKTGLILTASKALHGTRYFNIVITPLVATTYDLFRRVSKCAGLTCVLWSQSGPSADFANMDILILSAHYVNTERFKNFFRAAWKWVKRVAFDEAHEAMLGSLYRDCFHAFRILSVQPVPMILLSATVPPRLVPHLCNLLSLDRNLIWEFRSSTSRTNISYNCTKVEAGTTVDAVCEKFKATTLPPGTKGIIYANTVEDVMEISARLGIPAYHAKIKAPADDADPAGFKERLAKAWFEAPDGSLMNWIVATLAYGLGIDNPNVFIVIHCKLPGRNRIQQETGRAGRSGILSFSYIFYDELPWAAKDDLDVEDIAGAQSYAETKECRRIPLAEFDDGPAHSCAAIAGASLCDLCEERAAVEAGNEVQQRVTSLHSTTSVIRPSGIEQVPLTLEVHSAKIRAENEEGMAHLEMLKLCIGEITTTCECVACWVHGEEHSASHYAVNSDIESTSQLIRRAISLNTSSSAAKHWPFCYHCFVPFHKPCFHPHHKQGEPIDPLKCPGSAFAPNGLIPTIIATIFHASDDDGLTNRYLPELAVSLGVGLQTLSSRYQLKAWIAVMSTDANQTHNYVRFINHFHRIFHKNKYSQVH